MAKLSNDRYEYIKRKATQTLTECNINSIPINPYQICNERKYKLIKYSSKYSGDELKFIIECFPCGFSYIYNNEKIIEYNDSIEHERIRTTLFHEIGHLELRHTCECTLSETEAEWFGAYIIAPPPLVNIFKPDDYIELSKIFDTSKECGFNAMNRYLKWKSITVFQKDYENTMIKQFRFKRQYEDIEVIYEL
jgi:Zn-dependent peptidase ImmA (M78 family)